MDVEFKTSETFKNLVKAFEGEAKAHLKYQFYASQLGKVSKDIEEEIQEIIHNEKEHGKLFFKYAFGDGTHLPTNITNLEDSIFFEKMENTSTYPEYAEIAEKEGYSEIGELFRQIAKIEGEHKKRFEQILNGLESKIELTDKEDTYYKCKNCGYIHYEKNAPDECPVCKHPKKYFMRVDNHD